MSRGAIWDIRDGLGFLPIDLARQHANYATFRALHNWNIPLDSPNDDGLPSSVGELIVSGDEGREISTGTRIASVNVDSETTLDNSPTTLVALGTTSGLINGINPLTTAGNMSGYSANVGKDMAVDSTDMLATQTSNQSPTRSSATPICNFKFTSSAEALTLLSASPYTNTEQNYHKHSPPSALELSPLLTMSYSTKLLFSRYLRRECISLTSTPTAHSRTISSRAVVDSLIQPESSNPPSDAISNDLLSSSNPSIPLSIADMRLCEKLAVQLLEV